MRSGRKWETVGGRDYCGEDNCGVWHLSHISFWMSKALDKNSRRLRRLLFLLTGTIEILKFILLHQTYIVYLSWDYGRGPKVCGLKSFASAKVLCARTMYIVRAAYNVHIASAKVSVSVPPKCLYWTLPSF